VLDQDDSLEAFAFAIIRTNELHFGLRRPVVLRFDHHNWLVRFVEDRIGDPRMIRLIRKWLKAGVMEAGEWSATETGTPQGPCGFTDAR
jgi:RNA-directed DNA polymerase